MGVVGDYLTTDYPHLHFEIRYGGLYQYHNVNPWELLPYPDTVSLEVGFTENLEVAIWIFKWSFSWI